MVEHAAYFRQVRAKARQLFGDVDLDAKQRNFLPNPLIVHRAQCVPQARGHFGLLISHCLRHQRFDFFYPVFESGDTGEQHQLELFTFACARPFEFGHRLLHHRADGIAHLFGRERRILEHPRPVQYFHHPQFERLRHQTLDRDCRLTQAPHRFLVQLERPPGTRLAGCTVLAVAQPHLDLATRDAFGDRLPQHWLQRTGFIRQTKHQIKKARIDAFDFKIYCAVRQFARHRRVAGHGKNHLERTSLIRMQTCDYRCAAPLDSPAQRCNQPGTQVLNVGGNKAGIAARITPAIRALATPAAAH